jgi:pyruvate, water dikinase
MPEQWIYWFKEVGMEHNAILGKKCANLGELTKAGFNVPPGFALGIKAYERFMKETEAEERIQKYFEGFHADAELVEDTPKFDEASKVVRGIFESINIPSDMNETIRNYYAELCRETGNENTFVATRSAGPSSHPGQYETFLNVSGADDVVRHVIRVWASTFNTRSIISRARLNLPLHYDPIGVAVLTMVDAKAAGVILTVNPINGDESKVALEAGFGFGEAVVSGNVNPDRYLIDKVTLEIDEEIISEKNAEFAYNPETREMEYKELPQEKRKLPCLEHNEIIELTRISKKVEAHFGCLQDIEFSVSMSRPFPENLFLVQARPESVWGKKKKESVLGKKTGFELLFEKATTPIKLKTDNKTGQTAEKSLLKDKKILIVDDEPDILDTIEDILSECQLVRATGFDDAKGFLESEKFDAAILDIMGVNGYGLLDIANKRNVPALMLTAHAFTPDNVVKSIREGAASYIPKEELERLHDFLNDIFIAKEKGKSPLVPWRKRLSDAYFKTKFGAAWNAASQEFRDVLKASIQASER